MPRIPLYTSTAQMSKSSGGALIDPGIMALPFEAAARGGAKLAQLGAQAVEFGGQQLEFDKRLERTVAATRIENDLRMDIDSFHEKLLSDTNYEGFEFAAQTEMKGLAKKYRERAGGDRILMSAVETAISQQEAQLYARVRDWKRQVMKDTGQAEFMKEYESALTRWAWAKTPDEKEQIKGMTILKLELLMEAGVFSRMAGGTLERQFEERGYVGYFRELINSDAARAVEELQGSEIAPAMDFEKREILLSRAKEALKAQDSAERAKVETHVYSMLFSRFSGDGKAMRKAVLSPEVMKEFGITTKEARNIEGTITDWEKVNRERIEGIEAGYFEDHKKKRLTVDTIRNDLRINQLDPTKGIDVKTALFWEAKVRGENDEVTNPQAFNILHDKITRQDPTVTLTTILHQKDLSNEDRTQLRNNFLSERNALLSGAEATAKQVLLRAIYPTSDTGIFLQPSTAPAKQQAAYEALDKWQRDFVASGRVFDDKAAKEYSDFVSQVSKQYRTTLREAMDQLRIDMQEYKATKPGTAGKPTFFEALTGKEGTKKPSSIEEYERMKSGK